MLVPKLRFKEYNDEWKCKLFDQVFEFIQNNSFSRDVLNYSETSKIYNIHYGDILTKYGEVIDFNLVSNTIPRINNNISLLKFEEKSYLKDGDVIISDTAEDLTVGKACEIVNLRSKALAGLHTIPCRPKLKFASYYLGEYINSNSYHSQLIPYITGIKVSSISKSNIIKTKICFPSIQEQEKISRLLGLLNKKIKLQQRKIETLKMYKRGLMKRILKSNNWNELTLKQCCNGFDNLRKPITATQRKNGKIPYYGANGIQDFVDDYIINGEYILLAEDGGHFDEFMNKEIAQYILGKAWVNNHAHILQAKEGFNTKFIYYNLIHKDIRKYINGTSRSKLNQGDMWKINIKVPELTKQIEIAKILDSVDRIIIYENKKLSILVNLKKGFLERMFV